MEDHDSQRKPKKHKHKHKRKHTHEDYKRDDTESKRHKSGTGEPKHADHSDYQRGAEYLQELSDQTFASKRDQSNDQGIPDYDFKWEQHRYTLNQIFFTDDDYVKR